MTRIINIIKCLPISKKMHAEISALFSRKRYLASAKNSFKKGSKTGSFEDYKKALKKYWFSYAEYADNFELYNKTDEERNEFVSLLRISYFYIRYVPDTIKPLFNDKHRFLSTFLKYIHRKWLYAPDVTFEEFVQLVSNYDCIIKPDNGKCGKGVQKVTKSQYSTKELKELYESCVRNRMVVEGYIESCDEIKSLHPQSLNTIRVVTVGNKEKAEVFGAIIRIGVGENIVDNARAGGLFAQINVKEGLIESDGVDVRGNKYVCHPDSKIKFQGFKIPKWDYVVETCCEAAKIIGNTLTGWDVVINSQGNVEFVEGNLMPGFVLMQTPLKIGVKKKLYPLIKEYSGIEMK